MVPSPSLFSSGDASFSRSSSISVTDPNSNWSGGGGGVCSFNPTTPSSGIDWDLLDVLFTEDDNFKSFIYATDGPLIPRDPLQEFDGSFNVLSSMPPFDRREAHHDQTIEPFFSPCKNQAPELLQTFRTKFDPDSTDIVNNDPELPSVFGKRLSYRGDARMSDGQGSHVFRKFRSIEKFDTNLGSTQERWGTATTLYQVFGVLAHQCHRRTVDGGSFFPQVNGLHADNESIFDSSTEVSLLLGECCGTEETQKITSLYAGTESHTDTKTENPRSYLNQLVHPINHDYMPLLLYDYMPPSFGSSSFFFQEQLIERFPSVRYHSYGSDHFSQKQSHTLSISETNPEITLLASVASFISVSSEFSIDVLPCPEGFHRAEFYPRYQEILVQKLNLPVDKVFYYANLRDETTHKCPLGCSTEFPCYTIRQHMKKFHEGVSKGPPVQCNRGLLPEGSNIQCSGEKMSTQSFAHHFEDVHCRRSALCLYCATNPQV
ncbi:hypothetical protein EDD18DRAFT_1352444 [Armillaria luteobubalina]|uniref:REJ domain-containing protein n=1 Tax=Armillaria luteobubalina TaxID=153913 RepID=A0AA39Q7G7_9AGAR|nr:hypothetical protein EDD18DRAFT_1352444 [Armillaria luteobubalina]